MSVLGRRWAAVPALPPSLLVHPQKARALQVEARSGSQQGRIKLRLPAWQPWSQSLGDHSHQVLIKSPRSRQGPVPQHFAFLPCCLSPVTHSQPCEAQMKASSGLGFGHWQERAPYRSGSPPLSVVISFCLLDRKCVMEWEEPHDSTLYCLQTDGNHLLATGSSYYGVVRLWDRRQRACLHVSAPHTSPPRCHDSFLRGCIWEWGCLEKVGEGGVCMGPGPLHWAWDP